MNSIRDLLIERGVRYGEFPSHARVTQTIKQAMRASPAWRSGRITDMHAEAPDMIAHKIGRIVNGDPNHVDSWADLSGYAQLVVDELEHRR